jgi:hypothetical protein
VFSFGGDHGGEGEARRGEARRGEARRGEARRGEARPIFGTVEAIFGTAQVILHRRRDLRAGRLPLRLFGSDRNDDSQFSSRLALRR